MGFELNLLNHHQDHMLPRIFAAKVRIPSFTCIKKIGWKTVTLYTSITKWRRRSCKM